MEIEELNGQTIWNLKKKITQRTYRRVKIGEERMGEPEGRIWHLISKIVPTNHLLIIMPFWVHLPQWIGLTFVTNRIWQKWRCVTSTVIKALQILPWSPRLLILREANIHGIRILKSCMEMVMWRGTNLSTTSVSHDGNKFPSPNQTFKWLRPQPTSD